MSEKITSRSLLKTLVRPNKKLLLIAFGLVIIRNAASIAGPYLVKVGIDSGIPALQDDRWGPLVTVVSAFIFVGAVQALAEFRSSILISRVGQNILLRVRQDLFAHIQKLGISFNERFTSGRIISRLTSDVESIDQLFSNGIGILAWATLTAFTVSITLFVLDWQLALITMAVVPPLVFLTVWFKRNSFAAFLQTRETVVHVIVHFVESLRGIAAVQAFRREIRNEEIFSDHNEQYRQAKQRVTLLQSIYGPGVKSLGNIAIAAVLAVGTLAVADNRISIGVLTAFLLYLRRLIEPAQELSQFYGIYQGASAALVKISDVLSERPDIDESDNPKVLTEVRGSIEFRDVTFGYLIDEERNVLQHLDLTIPAGQIIAVVGPTGAGKSTLVRLMARLYDPKSGAVLLDDVDLRELSLPTIRRHVVMVTQENFLFSESVASNIAFGNPGATRQQIEDVAKTLGAHKFITALPNGYDAPVGKRGAELSAGERQLLAFARALLADPKVLLLDEATSSLDIPSERLVQHALEVLLADRTAVVIAHRLSTVEIADRVLVVDKGTIIEDGSPSELINTDSHYGSLHKAWQKSLQ